MNKSKYLIYLFFLFSFFVNAHPKEGVYIKDNAIFYVGHLSKEYNEKFTSLYNLNKSKVNEIDMNSGGGDVDLGMDLGDFIYKNKLNITIPDYCFSSCANYVFTSGNIKKINNYTLIGYHGGAYSFNPDMYLENKRQELGRNLTILETNKYKKKYTKKIEGMKKRQDIFYTKRNINKHIPALGDNAFPTIPYDMVYYSLKDFSKLGVNGIKVIGDREWSPKDRGNVIVKSKFSKDFSKKIDDQMVLFKLDLNDLKAFNISY